MVVPLRENCQRNRPKWHFLLVKFIIRQSHNFKDILKAPKKNKLVAYLCVDHVNEFLTKPELEKLDWNKRKPVDTLIYQNSY